MFRSLLATIKSDDLPPSDSDDAGLGGRFLRADPAPVLLAIVKFNVSPSLSEKSSLGC